MFENRALRRVFGPKRDEVTGEWRKLHNEETEEVYLSPNTFWMIKWRIMRWAGNVARVGKKIDAYKFLWRDLMERDYLEELGVDGRIIYRWILKTWEGVMDWIELAQDRDRWRSLVNAVMNLRVP